MAHSSSLAAATHERDILRQIGTKRNACHEEIAACWRFDYSELDKMEISTPRRLTQPRFLS
jgi:hypothetical protein